MTKYIDLDKIGMDDGNKGEENNSRQRKRSRLKRFLAVGSAATLIGLGTYGYIKHKDYIQPRVETALEISSEQSLEYRISTIKQDIKQYPGYADELIQAGINAKSGTDFSPETYMQMFGIMKQKIEQRPELLDHLGPRARQYQKSKIVRDYKEKLRDTYQAVKDKTAETTDKIKSLFAD